MLVLWIDNNEVRRKLFEKILKNNKISFHTQDSAKDFVYLVKDLSPNLIVIDSQTALSHLEELKRQYLESQHFNSIPVAIIDDIPELDFIKPSHFEMKSPIEAFEIPRILEELLLKN